MVFRIAQFTVLLFSMAVFLQATLQAAVSGPEKNLAAKTQLLNSSLTKYLVKHGHFNLTDEIVSKRSRDPEVAEGFEEQVVQWLVAEYGITVEDMHRLIGGFPVCGQRNCTSLPSMGSVCCPFG